MAATRISARGDLVDRPHLPIPWVVPRPPRRLRHSAGDRALNAYVTRKDKTDLRAPATSPGEHGSSSPRFSSPVELVLAKGTAPPILSQGATSYNA
jgi:hypothetical protein